MALQAKEILRAIGNPNLDLVRDASGYWYFEYDNPDADIYETNPVAVPRLNAMTREKWATIGRVFILSIVQNNC